MNLSLPDVAHLEVPSHPMPLEWVGMNQIDFPIVIGEPSHRREYHARVDAEVNLPRPEVKGIHMSRIYRLLDGLGSDGSLTPRGVTTLLHEIVESHKDCGSDGARLEFRFDLFVRRGALQSSDIGGWRSYPVVLKAAATRDRIHQTAEIEVAYSSTCPCSASLSRQLIEEAFRSDFDKQESISTGEVAAWLRQHATLATPHGQRSYARVSVDIEPNADNFGLLVLVNLVEHALATPVQTAVKRVDEQVFAAINGQNLMFVEDAARRIGEALNGRYQDVSIKVAHAESLHAHDAVASARF